MAYKRQTRDVYFRGRQALDPSKQLKETSNQQAQNESLFVSDLERQGRQYEQALSKWDKNEEKRQKELVDFWDEVSPAMAKLTGDTLKKGLLYQQKEDIARTWREYRALDPETRINIREGLRLHQEGEAERNTEARDIIKSIEELRDRKNEAGVFLLNEDQRGALDSYANFLRDRSVSSRSSIYLSLSREVASMLPIEINERLTDRTEDGRVFEHNGVSFTNAQRLALTDSALQETWAEVIAETIIEENRLRSDFGGLSNDTINSALYDIVENARLVELTKDKVRINEQSKQREYEATLEDLRELGYSGWSRNSSGELVYTPSNGLSLTLDALLGSGNENAVSDILKNLVLTAPDQWDVDEKSEWLMNVVGVNGASPEAKAFYYVNGKTLAQRLGWTREEFLAIGEEAIPELYGRDAAGVRIAGESDFGQNTAQIYFEGENLSDFNGMRLLPVGDPLIQQLVKSHNSSNDNVLNNKIIAAFYQSDGQLKPGLNNTIIGYLLERAHAGNPLSQEALEDLLTQGGFAVAEREMAERANSASTYQGTIETLDVGNPKSVLEAIAIPNLAASDTVVVLGDVAYQYHNQHAIHTLRQQHPDKWSRVIILDGDFPEEFEAIESGFIEQIKVQLEPYIDGDQYEISLEAMTQNAGGRYFRLMYGTDSPYLEISDLTVRSQRVQAAIAEEIANGTNNFQLNDQGRATHLLSGDTIFDKQFELTPEQVIEDINDRRASRLIREINETGSLEPGKLERVLGTENFHSLITDYSTTGHWPVYVAKVAAENGMFPNEFVRSQVGSDTITIGDTVISLVETPTNNISQQFRSPEEYWNFIKFSNDGSVISASRQIYRLANKQFENNGLPRIVNINTVVGLAKELLPSGPEALGYNQVDSNGVLRVGMFQMPEEAAKDALGPRYNRVEFLGDEALQEEAYRIWANKVIAEQHGLSDRTPGGQLDRELYEPGSPPLIGQKYSERIPSLQHYSESGYVNSVFDIILPPSAQQFSPQDGRAVDTQRLESVSARGALINRLVPTDLNADQIKELAENAVNLQRYFAIENGGF